MIFEDDVTFNKDYGHENIEEVVSLSERVPFDVVLMHYQAFTWCQLYAQHNGFGPTRICTLREVVEGIAIADLVPPHPNAPGAYCYLVTPAGAQKLIELADRFGAMVGVDWFILGCAVAGAQLEGKWDKPKVVSGYFANMTSSVDIGIAGTWLAAHADGGDVGASVIDHLRRVDMEDYFARLSSAGGRRDRLPGRESTDN